MLARLRLLLAMLLLCLGSWFAALAIAGYLPPERTAEPSTSAPGLSTSSDAQQFISFLTRERFVVEPRPVAAPGKPRVPNPSRAAVKARPAAVEKRRPPAGASWPWPLSLFGD